MTSSWIGGSKISEGEGLKQIRIQSQRQSLELCSARTSRRYEKSNRVAHKKPNMCIKCALALIVDAEPFSVYFDTRYPIPNTRYPLPANPTELIEYNC